MRDSDVAIGAVVLLGIVGFYRIYGFQSSSPCSAVPLLNAAIIKTQQNEIAAFDRETEIILSYFQNSRTMMAFRRLDAVFHPGRYEDWGFLERKIWTRHDGSRRGGLH